MNYYEELGVSPRAPQEEVHQAYRNAVKLMHPDRQMDPAIRQIAEKQMIRLNAIAQILFDPEQRLNYDNMLYRSRFRPDLPEGVARPDNHRKSLKFALPALALLGVVGAVAWTSYNDTPTYSYPAKANQSAISQPTATGPAPSLSPAYPDDNIVAYKRHLDEMTPALRTAPSQATSAALAPERNQQAALESPIPASPPTRRGNSVMVLSLMSPVHDPQLNPISLPPPPPSTSEASLPDALPAGSMPPLPAAGAVPQPVQRAASLVSQIPPVYPAIAKSAHVEGVVDFLATIGPDGRVRSASYIAGPPVLQSAAENAILKWRYHPAMLGNTPVPSTIQVSVSFRLN